MDAQVVVGAGTLVVRATDGWQSTPADGREPIQLDLDALLALVRAEAEGEPLSTGWEDLEPIRADAVVEPPDSFVGLVRGGWFAIEGFDAGRALLDLIDLCLLDALDGVVNAGPLYERADATVRAHLGVEPPGVDEWGARLRRLVAHNR
ncbi:MAG TPA: hypothetical protein PKA98_07480, partial [Acidimicrobiales bacterium]|nr:hypothetical protein [Acidimicrobiales bacterium]